MSFRTMIGLMAIAVTGCAFSPGPGPDRSAGIAAHHVRYSVMCEACQVAYTTGADFASENIKGSWSKTVEISGSVTRVVSLIVTPARTGILVQRARIDIDGRRMAEEGRNSLEAFGDQVTLTVMLDAPGIREELPGS